jgi:hypothetical protein
MFRTYESHVDVQGTDGTTMCFGGLGSSERAARRDALARALLEIENIDPAAQRTGDLSLDLLAACNAGWRFSHA